MLERVKHLTFYFKTHHLHQNNYQPTPLDDGNLNLLVAEKSSILKLNRLAY